nr:unnamed protein product [Digitaria exilis]
MAAANASTTTTTPLTMKLLVDTSPARRPRVVFAEAGKDTDTVDFLFSLLAVPAGTAVRLLGKDDDHDQSSMPGSMGNLYTSAEKLAGGPYAHPGAAKDAILCAAMPSPAAVAGAPNSCLFRLPAPAAAPKKFFYCTSYSYANCRGYVTEVSGTRCPNCNSQMMTEAKIVGSSTPAADSAVGFVHGGMATYTVTDSLVISPMSNVSTIALLNACSVRDFGSLQERVVQIGHKEGLEILRASLQSKTVLTDVFLGKNNPKPTTMSNGRGTNTSSSNGRRPESLAWRA